jgi:hypothetical protein
MKNYIFKIGFKKSNIELEDEFKYLSDIDKEKISNLNSESYFDYEINDKYNCIIITSLVEMETYINILKNNSIEVRYDNISKDILLSKISLKDIEPHSNQWDFFSDDLDDWILSNLEIDMILDRISEVGIENLSDLENKFLKNFNI